MFALAKELHVAQALWQALREDRDQIPGSAAEPLRQQFLANTVRNAHLRRGLIESLRVLNDAGVEPLLLKGASQLVDGTLSELGERWMADLDLLVESRDMLAAEAALRSIGYQPDRSRPWVAFEVSFSSSTTAAPIDLHSALGSARIECVLPTGDAWARSTALAVGNARARTLCPTHQVLHCVVHSAIQDHNSVVGGLPLRQLITLGRLVQVHGTAVDWAAIRQRMEDNGQGRVLRNHLWLAHRLAGAAVPLPDDGARQGARRHEYRVLAGFALGWPVDLQRNLRMAFGRAYMDALYAHGDRPLMLAGARVLHAARVLRRDGHKVLVSALVHGS